MLSDGVMPAEAMWLGGIFVLVALLVFGYILVSAGVFNASALRLYKGKVATTADMPIELFAEANGLRYIEEPSLARDLALIPRLRIARAGGGADRLLHRVEKTLQTSVFRFRTSRGSSTTVVAFRLERAAFARHVLAPEGYDFTPEPGEEKLLVDRALDAHYGLFARDRAAVRALFTLDVVKAIERHPGLWVEADGEWVAVYRPLLTRTQEDPLAEEREWVHELVGHFRESWAIAGALLEETLLQPPDPEPLRGAVE